MRWFSERYRHFKEIARWWSPMAAALYGTFWALDEAIEKWNPLGVKTWWDAYTTHLPSRWETWSIGFLVISVIWVLGGSFQPASRCKVSAMLDEHDTTVY